MGFSYFGLEEVLGSSDSDLVDVDFDLLSEDSESGVLAELAGRPLAEDEQELTEGDVAVVVLVNFLKAKNY